MPLSSPSEYSSSLSIYIFQVAHPKNGDLVEIIHHLGVIVGHIIPENFLNVLEVGRELLLLLILGKVKFHTVIN